MVFIAPEMKRFSYANLDSWTFSRCLSHVEEFCFPGGRIWSWKRVLEPKPKELAACTCYKIQAGCIWVRSVVFTTMRRMEPVFSSSSFNISLYTTWVFSFELGTIHCNVFVKITLLMHFWTAWCFGHVTKLCSSVVVDNEPAKYLSTRLGLFYRRDGSRA